MTHLSDWCQESTSLITKQWPELITVTIKHAITDPDLSNAETSGDLSARSVWLFRWDRNNKLHAVLPFILTFQTIISNSLEKESIALDFSRVIEFLFIVSRAQHVSLINTSPHPPVLIMSHFHNKLLSNRSPQRKRERAGKKLRIWKMKTSNSHANLTSKHQSGEIRKGIRCLFYSLEIRRLPSRCYHGDCLLSSIKKWIL